MLDIEKLKAAALACGYYQWRWWDSNSFRRLTFESYGRSMQDGGALHAVVQLSDGHPDVQMAPGVREFIELCSPAAIHDLLAEHDEYARILDGLPQDAIDGGWTAKGISDYAKRLEAENGRLREALSDMVTAYEHEASAQNPALLKARAALAQEQT